MPIKRGVEIALTQKITVLMVESDARMIINMLDTPYAQASLLNFVCRESIDRVQLDTKDV
ncbi:uncharacterized protein G2W53_001169 [Senna tora]|uniref:Uncharacterized protein n=1 Tax=Senna tora TaxID=362788 RepID=A0A834XH48_9FABA|nr:uncharacterized protein G2W53_001169 [Senna tora]